MEELVWDGMEQAIRDCHSTEIHQDILFPGVCSVVTRLMVKQSHRVEIECRLLRLKTDQIGSGVCVCVGHY